MLDGSNHPARLEMGDFWRIPTKSWACAGYPVHPRQKSLLRLWFLPSTHAQIQRAIKIGGFFKNNLRPTFPLRLWKLLSCWIWRMLVQTPDSAKLSQFLSSGAVMTACHLAVTLQLHSPAFAELHSCNNSGFHLHWLSGCCWWHGLPHVMRCSWSREKQISIPRLSIYPNCMIAGRHCNLCYLDIVAGGSQCSDYYPGG